MYEWIDNYIKGLVEMYGTNDIYELYDSLEIVIHKLPSNNILLQGHEAIYNRSYFGNEIVFIKDNINHNYEKFILAHELAHALIHTNAHIAAFNIKLLNINKYEKQANYFALKILNIDIFSVDYEGLTFEQIAAHLELPSQILKLLVST